MAQIAKFSVGFIGPGNIGAHMVRHALAHGWDVDIYDVVRTVQHEDLLHAGAKWTSSVQDLITANDVVFSCLPNPEVVREVYLGSEGILKFAAPEQIFVDHSVIHPDLVSEIASEATAQNAAFLDCPVSGGPEGARTGSLVGMIGGAVGLVGKVSPFISTYCSKVVHVGPAGKGQELKLINQMLVGGYTAVIAESWNAVVASGIDPLTALQGLNHGWGHSTLLERNFRIGIDREFAAPGATIDGFMHGFHDMFHYLQSREVRTPVLTTAGHVFQQALAAGYSTSDIAAVALTLAQDYQADDVEQPRSTERRGES